MAAKTFRYAPIFQDSSPAFPSGVETQRPILMVRLHHGNQATEEFMALVDTGADFCIFPADYAAELGLDLNSLPKAPIHGVGQDEVGFATIKIEVEELGLWEVKAGFSAKFHGGGMLGHLGFFDHIQKASFDWYSKTFQIST